MHVARERRRRTSAVLFLLALAAGFVAPSARAEPPAAVTSQVAEAKKLFEAGLRLKTEGLYKEALAAFVEANRLSPRESIQNNVALTYRLLRDMAGAYDAYHVLLATYGDTMKPKLKAETVHAIEALEVLTGAVTIDVAEPGARVLVDGREIGVTPLAGPVRLNLGTHTVAITKDGFDAFSSSIEMRGHDAVRVDGPLVRTVLTGHLAVAIAPPSTDASVLVYVDGKAAGPPPYSGELEPGLHLIEARGKTLVATPRQIRVERKGSLEETLQLHPRSGTLVVYVDVADSEITLDGVVVAHGVYEGTATAGAHALKVSKAGYPPYALDVVVNDGERLVEEVPLHGGAERRRAALHDWRGLYSQLVLAGQLEVTKPTNDVAQGIGYMPTTPIGGSAIYGGDLGVRVGYSLGALGIEGTVLLGYDHSTVSVLVTEGQATAEHPGPTPRTEDYEFHRVGGTAALGLRLMPKTRVTRPTLGVAGGVSLKGILLRRTIDSQAANLTGSYTENTNMAFYAAPSVVVDAGLELGSTPGTKLYLGCLMVADFAGAVQVTSSVADPQFPAPPAGMNAVNGTDVFVGPVVGMQLGE